tara:strand:- start:142 stop:570 length:429 start_codon:yes stop_codon:yes gene_type:complete
MAYKNAKDNRHNASIAKMMSKVKNPNFSIAKQMSEKQIAKEYGEYYLPGSDRGKTFIKDSDGKMLYPFSGGASKEQKKAAKEKYLKQSDGEKVLNVAKQVNKKMKEDDLSFRETYGDISGHTLDAKGKMSKYGKLLDDPEGF